jgi:hypothetical protein
MTSRRIPLTPVLWFPCEAKILKKNGSHTESTESTVNINPNSVDPVDSV